MRGQKRTAVKEQIWQNSQKMIAVTGRDNRTARKGQLLKAGITKQPEKDSCYRQG
jgi:hypothetical protein